MDFNLSFLLEQSSDFFCILNRDGTIAKTNLTLQKVLGYSEEELTGQKANTFFHPADMKRRDDLFGNLSANNKITGHENRIKAKDGRYYNVSWSIALNPQDDQVFAIGVKLTDNLNGSGNAHVTGSIEHIIQSFSEGFCIINDKWQITSFNPALQAITGLKSEELQDTNFRELVSLGMTDTMLTELENTFKANASSQVQYFNNYLKRWLRVNIYPYRGEIVVFIRDITNIKTQQLILALEKNVLELNASTTYTLSQTVNRLLKGIEEIYPDMICSVLEIDESQEKIYHMAAPKLPAEYCTAIDGSAIGPKAGSCGTAAYHRSQVIVSDIETNPLWEDYKELMRPYGIKACWSTPIISSNSTRVLATFAVYYTTNREPRPEELRLIERTTNILRVLIENKRVLAHVKDQNRRLQEIASISSHEIRRPVATILGLTNLFDRNEPDNPMNREIINHIDSTARELDSVIHTIVEKTIYLQGGEE